MHYEKFKSRGNQDTEIKESIKDRFSWNIFEDIDVFGKDEEDQDPQRLSASTIEELFRENGYNLDSVKKTKLNFILILTNTQILFSQWKTNQMRISTKT